MKIRVNFNDNKQYIVFVIGDKPRAFQRKNDCHAYYIGADERKKRSGVFGYIHIPVMDDTPLLRELIAHEVQHAIIDWVLCRKGGQVTTKNEERLATMTGEITRRFYAKWSKM
jgi:elongation factor P hydroxylase